MNNIWSPTTLAFVISLAFWLIASWLAGVTEPWDAQCYWTTLYPASLALSLMLGLMFRRTWMVGPIVMLGQIPRVVVTSGVGPLLAVGVLYSILLSIPAVMLSWIARFPLSR